MSTTTELVTILDISQNVEKKKKDGGTYKATILTVKPKTGGPAAERLIMQTTVDKSTSMQESLSSLDTGSIATLVHQSREGSKFTNIVGVHIGDVPDAQSQVTPYSGTGGGFTKKSATSTYDTSGAQVGNALNIAALMLAHKVQKGTLESIAEDTLRLGERLRAKLNAGVYKHVDGNTTTSITSAIGSTSFVDDEDVVF